MVRFGGRYLMYYSIPPGGEYRGWGIAVAASSNLTDWERVGELPLVGGCEANGIAAPGALVLRGRVHLFYQTYGNGPKDAICHAVSEDGIVFERNRSNPIFSPTGTWNCGRAIDADVVKFGRSLLLYWATRDPEFRVQMLGVSRAPMNSAFSRADWTQACDGPILKPELPWEQDCIEAPALFKRDGRLFMFYGGAYNNRPQQVGLAESTDGIRWTRVAGGNSPVLANGAPGDWNSSESGHPFAFTDDDGQVYLFFQGNSDNGNTWHLSMKRVEFADGAPLPWRASKTPQVHEAPNNAYWRAQGLKPLSDTYKRMRQS